VHSLYFGHHFEFRYDSSNLACFLAVCACCVCFWCVCACGLRCVRVRCVPTHAHACIPACALRLTHTHTQTHATLSSKGPTPRNSPRHAPYVHRRHIFVTVTRAKLWPPPPRICGLHPPIIDTAFVKASFSQIIKTGLAREHLRMKDFFQSREREREAEKSS
jgi:hypothetical protein